MLKAYGYPVYAPPSVILRDSQLSDRQKAAGIADYFTYRGKPVPKEIADFLKSRAARFNPAPEPERPVAKPVATAPKRPEPVKATAAPKKKTSREVLSDFLRARKSRYEGAANVE